LDVMSLENRSYLLANGYLDIGNEPMSNENACNLIFRLNAEMIKTYAFNNINSQQTKELQDVTLKQWKHFTADLGEWMSNAIDDEGKSFQTEFSRGISTTKLSVLRSQMKNTCQKRNIRVIGL